jgi:hypothetical protein
VIHRIVFRPPLAAPLWRLQVVATVVVFILLSTLPLAPVTRAVLCLVLMVIALYLWRDRLPGFDVRSLYFDQNNWQLQAHGCEGAEYVSYGPVKIEYFSNWLIMLTCDYQGYRHRLPIFRSSIGVKDYSRLLTFARSGSRKNSDVNFY